MSIHRDEGGLRPPTFLNLKGGVLRITKVAGHACIRVHKMGIPLMERGHDVRLIAKKDTPFVEMYKTFTHAYGVNHFIDSIDLHAKDTDVFHAHNEPSWFVTAIKERCDVPVVLDVHDSFLARTTPEEEDKQREEGLDTFRVSVEERNNFQMADALVFPAQKFADIILKEFKIKVPYIILPSYVPRQFYQYHGKSWLGGLVYEGRVDLQSDVDSSPKLRNFQYCVYDQFVKEAHDIGMDFHLYATRKDKPFMDIYEDVSFVHAALGFEDLLAHIGRHDWGLVGNVTKTAEWDVAFPNKLFEYIAAGVPIVAINASTCGEFIEEHGIGMQVESLEELASRWGEHSKCREKLIKVRQQFTMEKHIHKLEELYKKVAA